MRKIYVCPKCGGTSFLASAHVVQDWEIDQSGNFVASTNDCVEVTHAPDDDDIWGCKTCGYSAAGQEFLKKPDAKLNKEEN